jgi:hypothetical protein
MYQRAKGFYKSFWAVIEEETFVDPCSNELYVLFCCAELISKFVQTFQVHPVYDKIL